MELSQCVDTLANRGRLGFTLQSMANYHSILISNACMIMINVTCSTLCIVSELLEKNVEEVLEKVKLMRSMVLFSRQQGYRLSLSIDPI